MFNKKSRTILLLCIALALYWNIASAMHKQSTQKQDINTCTKASRCGWLSSLVSTQCCAGIGLGLLLGSWSAIKVFEIKVDTVNREKYELCTTTYCPVERSPYVCINTSLECDKQVLTQNQVLRKRLLGY